MKPETSREQARRKDVSSLARPLAKGKDRERNHSHIRSGLSHCRGQRTRKSGTRRNGKQTRMAVWGTKGARLDLNRSFSRASLPFLSHAREEKIWASHFRESGKIPLIDTEAAGF